MALSSDAFKIRFGKDLPSGPMTLDQLVSYTGGSDRGVTKEEFGQIRPEVQQQILKNPKQFLSGQMDYVNGTSAYGPDTFLQNQGGSGDLLSIGAEGGVSSLNKLNWKEGVGLTMGPGTYMGVNEQSPWVQARNAVETGAVLAGNYFVPGSSILTSNLASKESQKQLNTPLGKLGQMASSWSGSSMGNTLGTTVGNSGNWMDSSANLFKGAGALNAATGNSMWGNTQPNNSNTFRSNSNMFGNNQSNDNTFSWWNPSPSTRSTGGGNMANIFDNIGNMSLSGLADTASPFLSAWQQYNQKNQTKDAYGKAMELITTPSADQAMYRGQLKDLMSNPGSMSTSPVYQAMQDAGMNNVNRTAAAQGMLGSGNRLADLMKVGQDTASKYYFPQQQALASLSGVTGDTGARAVGANALLEGNQATNAMNGRMLGSLMKGAGVMSPQEKLLRQIYGLGGNTGGIGGMTLGQLGSGPGAGQLFGNTTDFGQGDWGSGTMTNPNDWGDTTIDAGGFSPGDWGYGTDTNYSDWLQGY